MLVPVLKCPVQPQGTTCYKSENNVIPNSTCPVHAHTMAWYGGRAGKNGRLVVGVGGRWGVVGEGKGVCVCSGRAKVVCVCGGRWGGGGSGGR